MRDIHELVDNFAECAMRYDNCPTKDHKEQYNSARLKLVTEIDRLTAELAELRTVLKSKEIIIDNQEKRINELAERLLKK